MILVVRTSLIPALKHILESNDSNCISMTNITHSWTESKLNPACVYLESKGAMRTPHEVLGYEPPLDMSVG